MLIDGLDLIICLILCVLMLSLHVIFTSGILLLLVSMSTTDFLCLGLLFDCLILICCLLVKFIVIVLLLCLCCAIGVWCVLLLGFVVGYVCGLLFVFVCVCLVIFVA